MSNWIEMQEEGQTIFVNEELGNIVKINDTCYIALFPKIIKFGPFTSLENAKQTLENCKDSLELALAEYNNKVVK